MTSKKMKNLLIPFIKGVIEDEGCYCNINWEAIFALPLFTEINKQLSLYVNSVQVLGRTSATLRNKEVL